MKSLSLALAVFALTGSAKAGTLADDLTLELYQMKSVYSAEYAPAQWKKKYAGYDLDTAFSQALAAVQANPNLTQRDAREILKNFIYAMKDYHTSISFVSTEAAILPFSVKGTDSRFFIMYINRDKLPESAFPFHVGDELVTFGGKPTAQAVADVQAQIPANVPTTDKALAEIYLTKRTGAKGYDVPKGPITIGVIPAGSTTVQNLELEWDYTPEKIAPRGTLQSELGEVSSNPRASGSLSDMAGAFSHATFRGPRMNVAVDAPSEGNPYDLGGRKTFTPDLGTRIWTSADTDIFYAYIYKGADGKLYGYFRLPQFEADDYMKATAEFARDVALFESTTDALVIDEANNPGGSVFYMYALGSMLATQPLTTPLHRMSITQADVSSAVTQIDQLAAITNDADAVKLLGATSADGFPVGYQFAQFNLAFDRFIVDQWNQGHKLTDPYWIYGVDHINPAQTHYTKPIVFLINHLDFSGGDFFPATLQDNKRVVIMGTRTAGAGGYVNDVPVPNNVGVNAFRCTESIAWRVDQNPIENLGVTPDVPYELTADDFANNYAGYVKAIQAELTSLTGAK